MSCFCGKCDLWDSVQIHGEDYFLNDCKIYIGRNIVPLKIESVKDLLPYAAYLVATACHSKEKGGVVRITTESYVDREEREILTWHFDDLKKIHRRCRRLKIPFNKEEALKECKWWVRDNEENFDLMFAAIEKDGQRAELPEDCHTYMGEYYRKELYDAMIEAGWREFETLEWVYGFNRGWKMWRERHAETTRIDGDEE